MEYFVLNKQETAVREDGTPLNSQDFQHIANTCEVKDRFTEKLGCFEALRTNAPLPNGYRWKTIRERFAELGFDNEICFRLARAKALVEWREKTQYCGCCGTKLLDDTNLTARRCPQCNNLIFPRIEPCIIVLITKQDKILLAKHVQRNQDIYACIAGFMEAGETAEHAVAREIYEETRIHVKNIRYFGSQSWPFPAQLMLAFTAEYESGEIVLQADEIADAQWFSRAYCPASPRPGSIAYRLIHETK